MKLCLFLHAHQPPTQFPKVLEKVCQESYRRIFGLLEENPSAKITLNLTASLVEQLPDDVIESIRRLVQRGQLELVGSAAYHPILPFLPEAEVERQILLNEETLKKYFGVEPPEARGQRLEASNKGKKLNASHSTLASRLKGFFPPEMAVDGKTLEAIRRMGYQWVLTEETAVDDPDPRHVIFNHPPGLKIVRRHRQLSLDIAFSRIRSLAEFLSAVNEQMSNDKCQMPNVVLALDAETFGHHRPEQLELLRELFEMSQPKAGPPLAENIKCQMTNVSDLINSVEPSGPVTVTRSTWAGSFKRWQNPQNPIHRLQWQLTNLAIKAVSESTGKLSGSESQPVSESVDQPIGASVDQDISGSVDQPIGASVDQNISESVGQSIGQSVDQDISGSVGQSIGQSVRSDSLTNRGTDPTDFTDVPTHRSTEFSESFEKARSILDQALHSDQYWWASHDPCWHYPMIERGARLLLDAVKALPEEEVRGQRLEARDLYDRLLTTAANLYGPGTIAC